MANTKYGLPPDVEFCTSCVISNQRPNSVVEFKNKKDDIKPTISFNKNGVCAACQYKEIKDRNIDWDKREKELQQLCDKYRSNDGSYDCLVPGSGGKDSRYVSHLLKYKYNMNPLTATWAPHDYTEIGFRNMISWFQDGFSYYLITPNRKLHRYLTREAFLNLGHPFQPFILGQKTMAPRLAKQLGIKLVFWGENTAEYGTNIEENEVPTMVPTYFTLSKEEVYDEYLVAGKSINNLLQETNFNLSDFNPYLPLEPKDVEDVSFQFFGYYVNWDPQEIYYFVEEKTGFEPNPIRTEGSYSRYSSIDDKIDTLHYYTTLLKFGLGRASYDAAQEIRYNKITREEGVKLVQKYDCERPVKFLPDLLDYLSITEKEFDEACDKLRPDHLWKKANGEWELINKIWES